MDNIINHLRKRLEQPLPGKAAQLKMMNHKLSTSGKNSRFDIPLGYKKASVMALLYPKNGIWHLALMERPESQNPHSRQISFPGGGYEEHDLDELATALRETEEEFGIPKDMINILGRLTELYIPVSNYLVFPYIGYLMEEPVFKPDPNEVERILEVPVNSLLDPANRKIKNMVVQGKYSLKDVPYFYFFGKEIWGATAMMLSELSELFDSVMFIDFER